VELFYEVELPTNMRCIHPIGTVLGRATYGEYLVFYHGCGVGSDVDGNRPTLGEGVVLFPGAKILGNVTLGNNVWVTANTVVQDCDIPSNSVVFPGRKVVRDAGRHFDYSYIGASWRTTNRSVKRHFFGVE